MRTVAIDFDGVIHAYSKGWHDGSIYDEPIPGAFEAIQRLQWEGIAVFVHTTREELSVASWLNEHRVMAVTGANADRPTFWNSTEVVLVSNYKLPAIAYIDDRGIRFQDWRQALGDLEKFERVSL